MKGSATWLSTLLWGKGALVHKRYFGGFSLCGVFCCIQTQRTSVHDKGPGFQIYTRSDAAHSLQSVFAILHTKRVHKASKCPILLWCNLSGFYGKKKSSLFVCFFIQLVNSQSFRNGFLNCSIRLGCSALYFETETRIQIKGDVFLGRICWRTISLLGSIRNTHLDLSVSVIWKYLPGCWIATMDLTC